MAGTMMPFTPVLLSTYMPLDLIPSLSPHATQPWLSKSMGTTHAINLMQFVEPVPTYVRIARASHPRLKSPTTEAAKQVEKIHDDAARGRCKSARNACPRPSSLHIFGAFPFEKSKHATAAPGRTASGFHRTVGRWMDGSGESKSRKRRL